jgi:putative thioredoxin
VAGSARDWVVDVEPGAFERQVVERSREVPVVVDFWAPWCQPCRMLAPLLERLVGERQGAVVLAKVNVDELPDVAGQFYISAIPAVKAFRDGRVVLEFEGLLPEPQLSDFLDRLVPSAADRLVKEAAGLEASDAAAAEKLYRQALEQDSRQEAAQLGLIRLLVARGADDEAGELLESTAFGEEYAGEAERLQARVFLRQHGRAFGDVTAARKQHQEDPENAPKRYELGCALAAAGQYEEALGLLLSAAERDPKLATAKVREVMVKVFYAVGVRSPLADEYRDKLSRLLY